MNNRPKQLSTINLFHKIRREPSLPSIKFLINAAELLQSKIKVLHDLRRNSIRFRQVLRVLKAFVLEPEDVLVDLVPPDEFIVAEVAEALVLFLFSLIQQCKVNSPKSTSNLTFKDI